MSYPANKRVRRQHRQAKEAGLKTTLGLIAVLAIISALAASALAQPSGGGRIRSKQPAVHLHDQVKKVRFKVLREKVGLNEARAKKVEVVLERLAPQRHKAQKQMRQARQQLRRLIKADGDDQQAYSKALSQIREAHSTLEKLRDQQFEELEQELTPKEQATMLHTLGQMRRKIRQYLRSGGKPGKEGRPGRRKKRGYLPPETW